MAKNSAVGVNGQTTGTETAPVSAKRKDGGAARRVKAGDTVP